jgi:hypothetical protein
VTGRSLGPPGNAAALDADVEGERAGRVRAGHTTESTVDDSSDLVITREEFVTRPLDLGRRDGVIPIYGTDEWEALDPTDPRRIASMVRAAECWRQEGEPEAISARLIAEFEVADLLARYRVRTAGLDVHEAGTTGDLGHDSKGRPFTWKDRGVGATADQPGLKSIAELQRLRRYEAPPERKPNPWPAELLTCPPDRKFPATRFLKGIPDGMPCSEWCCRRPNLRAAT